MIRSAPRRAGCPRVLTVLGFLLAGVGPVFGGSPGRRLRPRHPADPVGALLRLPRARQEGEEGRPPARRARGCVPRPVGICGDRARQGRRERVRRPDRVGRRRRADAAAEVRQAARPGEGGPAPPMGRAGGDLGRPLVVQEAREAPPAPGRGARLAAQRAGFPRAREAGGGGPVPLARGRPRDPDPPGRAST